LPARVRLIQPAAHLSPNRALGKQLAAGRGWTGPQWTCLHTLWTHESQWDEHAQNPTSTAYGVAQFLDKTWAGYGPKTSSPRLQITYGLAYIAGRYGTPCTALTKWSARSPHWY
jgi:hypothetical protein